MRLLFAAHAATGWKGDHNAAVTAPQAPGERRIMAQARALEVTINTLANDSEGGRVDPHAAESIVGPLADAFLETLNYERGRLDGGRLCEWLEHVTTEAGWDTATDSYIAR